VRLETLKEAVYWNTLKRSFLRVFLLYFAYNQYFNLCHLFQALFSTKMNSVYGKKSKFDLADRIDILRYCNHFTWMPRW